MAERTYGPAYRAQKEDKKLCIEAVHDSFGVGFYQCRFKRGKGKDGLYCGLHARMHARREENAKKCFSCKDTGHIILNIPTKFHCGHCKNGRNCTDKKCGAKE